PANALNSKEQHLGLCGKQKVAHQQHQTKGRTISSDIDSIQESVAMVTTPADVIQVRDRRHVPRVRPNRQLQPDKQPATSSKSKKITLAPLIQVSIITDSKTMANNKPKADVMCRGSPLFANHIRTDGNAATTSIHPTNALLNDPIGNCEAVNPIGSEVTISTLFCHILAEARLLPLPQLRVPS
ncbi:hypothetical protein Tco_0758083, partial [Tanacetum coccineum]